MDKGVSQLIEKLRNYATALEMDDPRRSGLLAFKLGLPDTVNPYPEDAKKDSHYMLWHWGWNDGWVEDPEAPI